MSFNVQVINTVVWAIPNLYVIIKDCEWFSTTINVCAFIKWMSWNSLFMVFVIEARNINFWKRNGVVLSLAAVHSCTPTQSGPKERWACAAGKVLRKHGKDRIVMDAPWWNHAWIFMNWCDGGPNPSLLPMMCQCRGSSQDPRHVS